MKEVEVANGVAVVFLMNGVTQVNKTLLNVGERERVEGERNITQEHRECRT